MYCSIISPQLLFLLYLVTKFMFVLEFYDFVLEMSWKYPEILLRKCCEDPVRAAGLFTYE